MTTNSSRSIMVNVPNKTDIVFLAMPFSEKFDIVGALIMHEVARSGLTLFRGDDALKAPATWRKELALRLGGARLVIAVCSPEPSSNQPNPNVMYELGLAHALGKPTIIVTNEAESLPRVLMGLDIVLYNDQDIGGNEFVQRLHDAIQIKGMSVSMAPYFALSRIDVWDNFVSILSCGLIIQKYFDEVHELLESLLQEVLSMTVQSRPFSGAESASWQELWARYSRFEDVHLPELLKQLERMSDALQSLQADVDLKTYAVVHTSRQMCFEVEESLKQYVDVRRRLAEKVARLEFSQEPSIMMYAEMKRLQAYTRTIRTQVGDLNSNTIRIITERGGTKENVS